MKEGNIHQEFRLKEIDKTRNYFIEELKQHQLIRKTDKKACKILTYTDSLLILASTVTGCVSISTFCFLICIPVDLASSATKTKVFVILAGIRSISQ